MPKIKELQAFDAFMRLGGVKLAADEMKAGQPMVSRWLIALEEGIGFALFQRKRNRLIPTPEAFQYHEAVIRNLASVRELEEKAHAIANAQMGQLVIAAQPIFCDSFLLDALQMFLRNHPDVGIRLIDAGMEEMLRLLSEGRCDMAIGITLDAEAFGARTTPLAKCSARCIIPHDHPLSGPNEIPLPRLRHEKFVELSPGSPLRARVDNMMHSIGFQRKIVAEMRTLHGVVKLVERGLGVAIVDPVALLLIDERSVQHRSLLPKIDWEIAQFVPRDRPLSKLGEAFSAAIMTEITRLKSRGIVF